MSNPNLQPPTTQTPTEIYYPESDGKPMAETDLHRDEIADLIFVLNNHFAARADVYVTGNVMFYYAEGNQQKFISPDVMVCFGVGNQKRHVYKLWQERVPSVVFEISSRKTWGEDLNKKWKLYEALGVAEYYIHDPEPDYLPAPLVAYKLIDGELTQLEIESGRVMSEALGLELLDIDGALCLLDPQTGKLLPTMREEHAARLTAEVKVQTEQAARLAAEAQLRDAQAEVARLRAELKQREIQD